MAGELLLPPGVTMPEGEQRGVVVNETDLPDYIVQEAVETYIEEHASMLGVNMGASHLSAYPSNTGSILARGKYKAPSSVFEEICLARDMAERDDDVAASIGAMLAIAFSEGFQNIHPDEVTISLFDEVAKNADLEIVLKELYRELLIAGSFTTVTLFTRETFQFQPASADRLRTRQVVAPLVGVLPAEQIRVLDNDMFRNSRLAYKPVTARQEQWLKELFDPGTTPARKAEMRREDPVLAAMLVEEIPASGFDDMWIPYMGSDPATGSTLYRLNPRMVGRTSFPKGAWKYPRPPLTRDFTLLEAKRLLNLMDWALLQGGANFLVVAKKGSDQRPALPAEIENLHGVIRRASRSGVIIGDHRLDIEIITPKLDELLNTGKRKLLARKIVGALLRIPDYQESDSAGSQGVLADVEVMSRVIAGDRHDIKRHVEKHIYDEAAKRNTASFNQGAAKLWFPKIILQGSQYFTDLILKLRDRGDIPRKYAVEAGGFDYQAAVQQRKREKSNGDDRVMTPAQVPFSSPNAGPPQDNGPGRPRGSSPNNGSGAPHVQRDAPAPARGEPVRAQVDEHGDPAGRMGELTAAILETYEDTARVGRLTRFEFVALERIQSEPNIDPITEGPLTIVPVNPDHDFDGEFKAVRLADGLSMIVGHRPDDRAALARALVFRSPEFSILDAEEKAIEWGFPVGELPPAGQRRDSSPEIKDGEEHAQHRKAMPPTVLNVHLPEGKVTRKVIERDEQGNIIGIREESEDADS